MKLRAKDISVVAVMCALLIGAQLLFTAVSGVEIVTVLSLCFCHVFGVKRGMLVATAFSLLRCLIWGFSLPTVILYLIYYNLFAFIFGHASLFLAESDTGAKRKISVIVTEFLFLFLLAAAVCFLSGIIKVSRLLVGGLNVLSWIIVFLCGAGLTGYNILLISGRRLRLRKLIVVTVLAAVCTVCFTLLDDVITPLFYGYTAEATTAYFYASFVVLLPQTVCVTVTVGLLFCPLTKIFSYAAKNTLK